MCACTLNVGDDDDDDDDDAAAGDSDYCNLNVGGACDCSVECGASRYGMSCTGSTCRCTKDNLTLDSFSQLGACTYQIETHQDAYEAVSSGCPVPSPCTVN